MKKNGIVVIILIFIEMKNEEIELWLSFLFLLDQTHKRWSGNRVPSIFLDICFAAFSLIA